MNDVMRIEFTIEPWSDAGHPPYVRAGIERAEASGLSVQLGPFGTQVEGPSDRVYPLMSEIVEAAMEAGAGTVSLQITRVTDDRQGTT